MLIIRLSRIGRKNNPNFRIVLQEHTRSPKGKVIEYLGHYSPYLKEKGFDAEKIKYWMSKGAKVSDTVHNLLVSSKVIDGPKRKVTIARKKLAEVKEDAATETQKANTETLKKEEAQKAEEKPVGQEIKDKPEAKEEKSTEAEKSVEEPKKTQNP